MLTAYIALGSNLGDRACHLSAACGYIQNFAANITLSPIYETSALMPEGAPDNWNIAFLNQVIGIETALLPHALLVALKQIEIQMGRTSTGRWAPRIIDLDIVSYGDQCVNSAELVIPHPAMHLRDFVLKPLSDIAPQWIYPPGHALTGTTVLALLQALPHVTVACYDSH